jgi:ribosome-dependent ATPase
MVSHPVAELTSVTHRYGSTMALDNVSISITSGQMVGIIGPDGVGKSTLLGLVAGIRKMQNGGVQALGGDMADQSHRQAVCARIAYMPQGLGRNLYPTLTVLENIDFFGRLFGQSSTERSWRITDLLSSTGLTPFADRPAGKLSGGMKQKLSLCCSLIHDPDLLVLDEPTTGVDPLSRKQFWELIDRIRTRRSEMSVIVATAYMEEAEQFDQLIALDDGRVLATGTPAEIKSETKKKTLEDAFIALLPLEKSAQHRSIIVPPRTVHGGEPAIEADGLTMRFGDFMAVDHVSVKIDRGEIFGFLGSNGCGKTTTMKMLTGLLSPSEGRAKLFGHVVDANDIETRRRVGYMSQTFSLYSELSVRQNLDLHASLFDLPVDTRAARIEALMQRFGLVDVINRLPESLPLGVRQRLQLAVAVLHEPEMLILDEPTSGVDPIARDQFWELLIELSRDDGVTIFISTHFVNEAERCDRISLMHAGRVLALDTPDALRQSRQAPTLEVAFIGYLEDAVALDAIDAPPDGASPNETTPSTGTIENNAGLAARGSRLANTFRWFDPRRSWAFARRESVELIRDPIRLAFALLGPVILAIAMINGISFDVEQLRYAALDQDRSAESQGLLDTFSSLRYFDEQSEIGTEAELEAQLRSGVLRFALVIPPDFGRDLLAGRSPVVGVWFDGAITFQAEAARGFVQGAVGSYLEEFSRREDGGSTSLYPADIQTRFRYNQAFVSYVAISPGVLMLLLYMFSTMLTALGVVREKELGSITNLYAAPASKMEFLVGKQLPYVAVAMIDFVLLVSVLVFFFCVPITGNVLTLVLGALLFAMAATSLGLVISTVVSTQLAAIFASAIIVMIPSLNLSGMLYPVSTLEGAAYALGHAFPALYFQKISSGVFSKGLGFSSLFENHLWLIVFCLIFWVIASLLLKKQET